VGKGYGSRVICNWAASMASYFMYYKINL
jgi:hypothetical protein